MTRKSTNLEPFLLAASPQADHFEQLGVGIYAGYQNNSLDLLISYVKISEADGYGGPMRVATAVDKIGNVVGLAIIEHRETPSWYEQVKSSGFIRSLANKSYLDKFELGSDIDAISGATCTTKALTAAVRKGSRSVAKRQLGLQVPKEAPKQIKFGVPELVLLALVIVWFIGNRNQFKYKKQVRLIVMMTGLVVLGFLYAKPLTISHINMVLLGFWPEWQTNLYWYMLVGFFLFTILVEGKNPYCQWICPFGAVQETLGMIGGAKSRNTRFQNQLKQVQKSLALIAIIAALLFRNPVISSYEIFGTLFNLKGSAIQFGLLGLILIASLLIRRPWCRYLCPIGALFDFLKIIRSWIKESWLKRKKGLVA